MSDQEKIAFKFISEIEAAGHQAYIVGGTVRDRLLGLPMKDVDVVSSMPMAELRKRFKAVDVGKSKDFGICVVLYKGCAFETANFRGETCFGSDGRPTGMEASVSFAEDASRRDFTVNAMGLDSRGEILDPFGGAADLEAKLLRCVGNPLDRFAEDPLRVLRAVRLAARFNFEIEKETGQAMGRWAAKAAGCAPERISGEIAKMASLPGALFARAVELMDQVGLLEVALPEITALKGLPHDKKFHPEGDVYEHTLAAVSASREEDALLNLSVFFHDVGKAAAFDLSQGKPRYAAHERLGVEIISNLCDRLRFPNAWKSAFSFVSLNHMKVARLDVMRPSKVFALVQDERWPLLKKAAYCDQAARGELFDEACFGESISRAEQTAKDWTQKLSGRKVAISGDRVMELTGLQPGPEVGETIRSVTAWAIDNGIENASLIESRVREIAESLRRGNKRQ